MVLKTKRRARREIIDKEKKIEDLRLLRFTSQVVDIPWTACWSISACFVAWHQHSFYVVLATAHAVTVAAAVVATSGFCRCLCTPRLLSPCRRSLSDAHFSASTSPSLLRLLHCAH